MKESYFTETVQPELQASRFRWFTCTGCSLVTALESDSLTIRFLTRTRLSSAKKSSGRVRRTRTARTRQHSQRSSAPPSQALEIRYLLSSSFLSSIELSATKINEPYIRVHLGTALHFCQVAVLRLRTVPIGTALSYNSPSDPARPLPSEERTTESVLRHFT